MIGKHVRNTKKTSSFKALNTYILSGGNREGKKDKVSYANCVNLHSLETATIEMEMMQLANKKARSPVLHTLLSWREGEQPTQEQIDEAALITLKELDLQDCQAVYALHKNTDNFHLHICTNRISPQTHKAIDPAHGWTDKAMERVARKVEAAQGWEIEKNAWTRVTEDGYIESLNKGDNNYYLPRRNNQKVNDMENASGEESAISKGKAIIIPLLNNKDIIEWGDIHRALAAEGIVYEKKGSGAIFRIGEIVVKASSISRSCTLSNLEKKLGVFEKSGCQVSETATNKLNTPSPTSEAKHYTTNWEHYVQDRAEYYENKKRKRELLRTKHLEEWQGLKQIQVTERQEIKAMVKQPLKGTAGHYQRQIINALRSAVAAQQAGERAALKEQQNVERYRFYSKENPPYQSYKGWLVSQGLASEAQRWRYKRELDREQIMTAPNGSTAFQQAALPLATRDIRDYTARIATNRKQVLFVNKWNMEIAFIDSGRFLNVLKNDKSDLLAALQLAVQKWGSVELKGTEEYKRKCLELAVVHNIKITNPELQDAIAWAKEQNDNRRGGVDMKKELENFRAYHAAVAADRYAVSAIEFFENGENRGFMVSNKDGFPDGFPPDHVEYSMKRLVGLKNHGRNIYYTPTSEKKHHILIDDLDGLALADLIAQGYKPAVIIESSPANYQAIITIPKLGTEFDRQIGNRIVAKLNKEFGDPKLSGEIHAHRAPGFDNKKIKHRREDGSYPDVNLIEAKGGECDKTQQLALVIKEELEKLNEGKSINLDFVVNAPETVDTEKAYKIHFKDVLRLQRKRFNTEKIDVSRVDYMVCMRLRATGHSAESVEKVLTIAAPETRKLLQSAGSHNWEDYAKRTTGYVFTTAKADREIDKLKGYIDHWRSLEGQKKAKESSER